MFLSPCGYHKTPLLMSLTMLPQELLDAVCENLAGADLSRLSYTASFLHVPAQRQLYRHVSISSSRRNLAVLFTLARKPEIAHHVRSFSIDLDSQFTFLRAFYHQLANALANMPALTSLHLFIDPNASWVLQELSYPRLLHFASPFPLDSHVSGFLSRTPALLELEVDSLPFRHERPASASILTPPSLPLLQQFVGSSHAAESIVPSRPVHSVQLTAGDLTEHVVARLSGSTAEIVTLSATTSSSPAALLQILSKRMQYLVHLRLMTMYSFSEAPDVNFYSDIAGALNVFSNLQTFELSGMHWGSQERKDAELQRVWQSQALETDINPEDDARLDIDSYSDLFFGY
jgi:hypothetical protein